MPRRTPAFLAPAFSPARTSLTLRNARSGAVVARSVELAAERAARRRGLLGRECFDDGGALVIAPCSAIHTWFMRFAIDVLFVSQDGTIVKARAAVRPWRLAWSPGACLVIELPEGTIARTGSRAGDRLVLDQLRHGAV